jgi:carbamoyltransferase
MIILGLSGATQHDPAACLVVDGKVIAMVEEERLTRIKHGREQLPIRSILYCLAEADLKLDDVDVIASSWDSAAESGSPKFGHFVDHLLVHEAFRYSRRPAIEYIDHHLAHAASAFYSSGFPEAAVLVADGAGENTSTSIGFGRGSEVRIDRRFGLRHSLGHFFTFAAEHTGLGSGNEGKLMGLAAYGTVMGEVDPIRLEPDGYSVELAGLTDMPMDELWAPLYEGWRDWFTRRFGPPNTAQFTWDRDNGRP